MWSGHSCPLLLWWLQASGQERPLHTCDFRDPCGISRRTLRLKGVSGSSHLLAQFAAQNFSRGGLRDSIDEVNLTWLLVMSESVAHEGA